MRAASAARARRRYARGAGSQSLASGASRHLECPRYFSLQQRPSQTWPRLRRSCRRAGGRLRHAAVADVAQAAAEAVPRAALRAHAVPGDRAAREAGRGLRRSDRRLQRRAPLPRRGPAARDRHRACGDDLSSRSAAILPRRSRWPHLRHWSAIPEALLLVLPSDHTVTRPAAFRRDALQRARARAATATSSLSASFPMAADTGYGYIERGAPIDRMPQPGRWRASREARPATRRVLCRERQLLLEQRHVRLPARKYLEELARLRPEMLAAAEQAYAKSQRDLDFLRLDSEAFAPARRTRSTTR